MRQNLLFRCVLIGLLLFPPCLLAQVLVVTSEKSTLTVLGKNQVRNIFLGKLSVLPDGKNVIPIDRPESSPLRDEFYAKRLCTSCNTFVDCSIGSLLAI